jgi:hypothetical protein
MVDDHTIESIAHGVYRKPERPDFGEVSVEGGVWHGSECDACFRTHNRSQFHIADCARPIQ